MELGTALLQARSENGVSQGDVAEEAGVSRVEIHRIERGTRMPRPDVWWRASQKVHLAAAEAVSLYVSQETRAHTLISFAQVLLAAQEPVLARRVLRWLSWLNTEH